MANINPNGLPNKIYMRDLSTILGSGGALQAAHLNEILLVAESNKLPIYFNKEMYGAEVSAGVVPIYDDDGDVTKIMVSGKCFHTGTNHSTYLTGQGFDYNIMVSSYAYNGKEYYPTDVTGIWQDHPCISATHFYCNKKELLASGLLVHSPKKPTSKPKKIPRQQPREDAMRHFLAGKAGSVKTGSLAQAGYKALGEPTQAALWKTMQAVDPNLFAAGKDDFFDKQKVIKLKIGARGGTK